MMFLRGWFAQDLVIFSRGDSVGLFQEVVGRGDVVGWMNRGGCWVGGLFRGRVSCK